MGAVALQQQPERKSGWERAVAKFGAAFREQGLSAADIPAAIITHEVVGLAMAAGFWTACYAVQPSKTVARPLVAAVARSKRGARAQAAYSAALGQATRTVARMPWLNRAPGVDPARLTVSLAESLCLRACIKPITFTFKIWASYKLVLLGKQLRPEARQQQRTREQQAAAEAAGGEQGKRRGKAAGAGN
ncbi:hypothetical protein ABPG75_000404 [Micractinium tetrahymenae]